MTKGHDLRDLHSAVNTSALNIGLIARRDSFVVYLTFQFYTDSPFTQCQPALIILIDSLAITSRLLQ